MRQINLPTSVEGITAEWLTRALQAGGATEVVETVEVGDVIWGTATKVLVDVRYAVAAAELPSRLCVKGGFVPELRAVMATGYEAESRFYAEIAPGLEGAARCYFAGTDASTGQSIVILDDLVAAGAAFCDARQTLTTDEVAQGLELLASWHARDDLRRPFLDGAPHFRTMVQGLWNPAHWDAYVEQATDASVAQVVADRDRVARAFRAVWDREDARPASFVHGDANLTNLYRAADGRLAFLDWQFACRTDPFHDVGLFVMGALGIEDRRAAEQSLIKHYLDARGPGAEAYDDAWEAYRAHSLHGAMYALTPEAMQPAPIRDALAPRFATAALDLDTFALLGV